MNLYAFVGNNPVNLLDPLGLSPTRQQAPPREAQDPHDPLGYLRRPVLAFLKDLGKALDKALSAPTYGLPYAPHWVTDPYADAVDGFFADPLGYTMMAAAVVGPGGILTAEGAVGAAVNGGLKIVVSAFENFPERRAICPPVD